MVWLNLVPFASEGIYISHHVYDELTLRAPEEKKMEAARLLRDAFYHGFHTCFPTAPDTDLVEIGSGKTRGEAGSDEAIIWDIRLGVAQK